MAREQIGFDDLQRDAAMQPRVQRLVGNAHRPAPQFPERAVLAGEHGVMLQPQRRGSGAGIRRRRVRRPERLGVSLDIGVGIIVHAAGARRKHLQQKPLDGKQFLPPTPKQAPPGKSSGCSRLRPRQGLEAGGPDESKLTLHSARLLSIFLRLPAAVP